MSQTPDEKCLFALIPDATGDGVPLMIVGIPAAAYANLLEGRSTSFDLTKAGVPVKLCLFGAETHDAAMKLIEQVGKDTNTALLDEHRKDWEVKLK